MINRICTDESPLSNCGQSFLYDSYFSSFSLGDDGSGQGLGEDWSGGSSHNWSHWSSHGLGQNWSHWGNSYGHILLHHCVETVDGVGVVADNTTGTIGLDQRVGSTDDITITSLLLGLGVTGQRILYIVGELVLWVGIHDLGGDGSSNWSSQGSSNWSSQGSGNWSNWGSERSGDWGSQASSNWGNWSSEGSGERSGSVGLGHQGSRSRHQRGVVSQRSRITQRGGVRSRGEVRSRSQRGGVSQRSTQRSGSQRSANQTSLSREGHRGKDCNNL